MFKLADELIQYQRNEFRKFFIERGVVQIDFCHSVSSVSVLRLQRGKHIGGQGHITLGEWVFWYIDWLHGPFASFGPLTPAVEERPKPLRIFFKLVKS